MVLFLLFWQSAIADVSSDPDRPVTDVSGNDAFSLAHKIPIAGGIFRVAGPATLEASEPFHGQQSAVTGSVWFNYSAPTAGSLFLDLAGSLGDPILAVYTGDSPADLAPVQSALTLPLSGAKASLTLEIEASVTYRIAVAGVTDLDLEQVCLRVIPGGGPDLVGPIVILPMSIPIPPERLVVTNATFTVSGTVSDPTPFATGVREVVVQLDDAEPVAATGVSSWMTVVQLSPGDHVISARARDIAGNWGDWVTFIVDYVTPFNDNLLEALPLIGESGTTEMDTALGSIEPGEPAHAGNAGGHSIWYTFEAPAGGILTLSTIGSAFDTLLGVYAGDAPDFSAFSILAENDDAMPGVPQSELSVEVNRGQTVWIAIDGFGGQSGLVLLQWGFVSTERFVELVVLDSDRGDVWPESATHLAGTRITAVAVPKPGFEFVRWTGSLTDVANPLALILENDTTLAAEYRPLDRIEGVGATEDFESGDLNRWDWRTFGDAPWSVQSDTVFAGSHAARSGTLGPDETSSLAIKSNLLGGPASFKFRLSSPQNRLDLEFLVNGEVVGLWSGDVPWQNFAFLVESGENVLEWRLIKRANFTGGFSDAFIDDVYLPLDPGIPPLTVELIPLSDGSRHVVARGPVNQVIEIERSTDFSEWVPVRSGRAPLGILQWTDPDSISAPGAFYRAGY